MLKKSVEIDWKDTANKTLKERDDLMKRVNTLNSANLHLGKSI